MELIPGKEYYLVYSTEFCHIVSTNNKKDFQPGTYTFLGRYNSEHGLRNIFIGKVKSDLHTAMVYVMFGAEKVNYIKNQKDVIISLIKALHDSSDKLEQIQQILNN